MTVAGNRTPGEDDEAAVRPGADQLAEGLPLRLALHLLKIVDQQNLPVLRRSVQRECRTISAQTEDARPESNASATTVFPKPQGVLKNRTRP